QVLSSYRHRSPEPSSHHAPKIFGLVSPTFDCANPATKPSANLLSSRVLLSKSHAATPILSPVTKVLLLYIEVPCTGKKVRIAVVLLSDSRSNLRSVMVLSTLSEYRAFSSSGFAS